MDLQEIRKNIDRIDDQLIELFAERMKVSADVAEYKMKNNMPVLDAKRERDKLNTLTEKTPAEFQEYIRVLYSVIFEVSRSYQHKLLATSTELSEKIANAIENTPKLFPPSATVACQGTEGAYSQIACEKLFKNPNIVYTADFEKVFSAIESGLCQFGILPLENSTAGSVTKVYELMQKHNFNIVRSTRIKVDHNLYVHPDVKDISQIKEIVSHEQALNQSMGFIKSLGNVKITPCENTAVAAEMVSKSERRDIAALASHQCAELYNLRCLKSSVQDKGNNYTRFICISKNLEIYPGANKTSVMMTIPHKPGALYKVLARFYSLGINLIKLESRPLPDKDFEFMFYFDLETSIYSPEFMQLMAEFENICETFCYLGSYAEVI